MQRFGETCTFYLQHWKQKASVRFLRNSAFYLAPDNAEINLNMNNEFQHAENKLSLCLIQCSVELPADCKTLAELMTLGLDYKGLEVHW